MNRVTCRGVQIQSSGFGWYEAVHGGWIDPQEHLIVRVQTGNARIHSCKNCASGAEPLIEQGMPHRRYSTRVHGWMGGWTGVLPHGPIVTRIDLDRGHTLLTDARCVACVEDGVFTR